MTYQEILQSINYPTDILTLDFETYFDQEYSLKKMSTIEFVTDKRFEFLGLGLYWSDANEQVFIKPSGIKETLEAFGMNSLTVVVQNARFDITILQTKFGIVPKYIINILDLARYYDARMKHTLASLCKLFGLKPKGDTNQFKGLHYKDMTSEQWQALVEYGLGDVESETELLKILLPYLTNPTMEIPLMQHTLKMWLQPKIQFDFKKAGKLSGLMLSESDKIIESTGYSKSDLSGNLSFNKILADALPNGESIPMKPGKNKPIPALAKSDEAFQELLVHSNEQVRNLCQARQAVKSWPLHIKRIDKMASQADCSGGFLRVPDNYHSNHTGRWGGAEGINLKNLGGRGRAGSGINPLIGQMRNLLIAPEGYLFAIADSSQIEARVLAWIAGQIDLLDGFAHGEDIYSVFATQLFDSLVYKPSDNEPDCVRKLLKIRRGFGKDGILGCGYGMGAQKFYNRCRANEDLRPLFASGEYNFAFIERLIKTYRETYAEIPKFWKQVEESFRWIVKYPHEIMRWSIHQKLKLEGDLLTFWNENGTVIIQLPSGRCLRYRHASIDKKNTLQWHWGKLWGGAITENIVQAIARDLLGWWVLECENIGINIVFHNHDEIMSIVPDIEAKSILAFMLDIMRNKPKWADGLPLDAEGKVSKAYTK